MQDAVQAQDTVYHKQGVNLVLTARREDRLQEVCRMFEEKGTHAVSYAGDAVQEETAERTVKLAMDAFGRIDMLLSNAGIGIYKPFLETTMEDYDQLMDTNVRSSYAFLLHTVPVMVKNGGGQIIIVSSVTGMIGAANETACAAAKFANRGMAQSLNQEFRKAGLMVTCFEPSAVYTEFEIGSGRTAEGMEKRKGTRVMEMHFAGMQGN